MLSVSFDTASLYDARWGVLSEPGFSFSVLRERTRHMTYTVGSARVLFP